MILFLFLMISKLVMQFQNAIIKLKNEPIFSRMSQEQQQTSIFSLQSDHFKYAYETDSHRFRSFF